MSLYKNTGTISRSPGIWGAIYKQLKLVNLKPVKKVEYTFDPFHPSAKEFRNLIHYLSHPYVRNTNIQTAFKTEIVCDLSEPICSVKLANDQEVILKSGNLSTLELLTTINRFLKPLIPPPEPETPTAQTKSQKKKK